ncbi:hypothetical protein BKA24_002179 [Microbacterium marinum]|uniref:Uncharacterized protein n=1 Tax=Microbacterium marinum TaxID=421115 RepID=A0A7W7BRE9_9MICO|nr:hypothetical protein [Microbacterium marinum]
MVAARGNPFSLLHVNGCFERKWATQSDDALSDTPTGMIGQSFQSRSSP